MPPIICPRCQRANPQDAAFCYYDGINLRGSATGLASTTNLGKEFVFPTGRRCRTFEELVLGCSEDWDAAKQLLRQGSLKQFFASTGRMDLAVAADRAAAHQDADLGLDQFLGQLPTSEETRPKLDLAPRRLHMPALNVGEQREFTLTIVNQGARLLHGTMELEADTWLVLQGQAPGQGNFVPIKTGRKQQFQFTIKTAGLPAGQRYAAKLTLITNGGVAEVPVTVDVVPVPFQIPPLQGAATPRELAASMKEVPKQVYHLLENGSIRDWFIMNGWHYPVTGPEAKGIAAVQQFFEGLGLSKPPELQVEPKQLRLDCLAGSQARGDLMLHTHVKKWVYAHVSGEPPWLKIAEANVSGAQRVGIAIQVDGRRLTSGQRHEGMLHIVGNSNQVFHVPVHVQVGVHQRRFLMHLVQVLLIGPLTGLILRLMIMPVDLLARGIHAEIPPGYVQRFSLCFALIGVILGGRMAWKRGQWHDVPAGLLVGGMTFGLVSASLANLIMLSDRFLAARWPSLPLLPMLAMSLVQWTLLGIFVSAAFWLLGPRTREWLSEWSAFGAEWCHKLGWQRMALFLRS